MLEWKRFNLEKGNVMTTITNAVFTVLNQKLCWKMKILHMLVGIPRARSSNLFFFFLKQVLRVTFIENLFFLLSILLKDFQHILQICEGFFLVQNCGLLDPDAMSSISVVSILYFTCFYPSYVQFMLLEFSLPESVNRKMKKKIWNILALISLFRIPSLSLVLTYTSLHFPLIFVSISVKNVSLQLTWTMLGYAASSTMFHSLNWFMVSLQTSPFMWHT